jgi:putative lipoprotein (rSAM/lipoprotein system)
VPVVFGEVSGFVFFNYFNAVTLPYAAKICIIASCNRERNLIMKLYKYATCIVQMFFFGLLLSVTGACSPENNEAMAPSDMLSSPTNNYTLNGNVVSATNEQAGIPEILIEISIEKNNPVVDTLYTDLKGAFKWTGAITTFGDNVKLNIAATDISGTYKKNRMVIIFNKNDISKEDNTWFLGEAEKSLTIKLEKNN